MAKTTVKKAAATKKTTKQPAAKRRVSKNTARKPAAKTRYIVDTDSKGNITRIANFKKN